MSSTYVKETTIIDNIKVPHIQVTQITNYPIYV